MVICGDLMDFNGIYPLVMTNITMENHPFQWKNPLVLAIFHSYVKLPEGVCIYISLSLCVCNAEKETSIQHIVDYDCVHMVTHAPARQWEQFSVELCLCNSSHVYSNC